MTVFVTIAQITRIRGIRGEVSAWSLTDFPERFEAVKKVRIETPDAAYWETLESYRFHKNRVLLKFEGLNRPNEVEHLVGGEVQVPEAERVKLPSDTYFHSDLIGSEVHQGKEFLGIVKRVLETGAAALLVVEKEKGEILVPLTKQYLEKVDVIDKRIEVNLPSELIELNQASSPSQKGKKVASRPENGKA